MSVSRLEAGRRQRRSRRIRNRGGRCGGTVRRQLCTDVYTDIVHSGTHSEAEILHGVLVSLLEFCGRQLRELAVFFPGRCEQELAVPEHARNTEFMERHGRDIVGCGFVRTVECGSFGSFGPRRIPDPGGARDEA